MPVKRRSSSKVATTVNKSPSAGIKVTKYSKPLEIKKVTETPTPTRVRPAKPNLSLEDYREDVKVRWEIHQWETQELWNDIVKGYNNTKPFVIKSVDYVKDSYSRAFD